MQRTIQANYDRFALTKPFRIARGVKTAADVVTVTIGERGVVGRGEGVPYPRYGESVATTLAAIEGVRAAIEAGAGCEELLTLLPAGAARNAVDCALWDLEAKRSGRSVAAMLGLDEPVPLASALTIVIDTPEAMAAAAAPLAGVPLLKVKVDANDPAAQLLAVRAVAPAPRLIVDPNESWNRDLLETMQPLLVDLRADLLEQPVSADDDAWLEEFASEIPICADEAVHVAGDLDRLAARYDVINVKLDKAGGLTAGMELARAARARGLGLMTGCMVCSSLGIAPALLVAGLSDFVDLDGPVWLAEDRAGGVRDRGRAPRSARRSFLGDAMTLRRIASIAGIAVLQLGAAPPAKPVDLLIRGGTVYTGSDAPFAGDVAISGDHIVAVGKHLVIKATRTIDAKNMIVAPGFIDPHTHVGGDLASDDAAKRLVPAFLMQGVTTAFIGNDGGGSPDVAKVLGAAKTKPVGINYATYVGFGAVREHVVGEARRDPTTAEMTKMKGLVAGAMCQGAMGLSTGLYYAPQSFSKTPEVVELAREAAIRGGTYDSHIRDESSYTVGLKAAIAEAIEIGREAKMPVHISHIKALGVDVQGQAPAIVAMVEAARKGGQDVTADQYPWSASGTSLVASLVPLWAQDGGRTALLERFYDASLAGKLRTDMTENLRKRGGAESLLITEGQFKGHRLSEIAKSHNLDAVAAAIAVIRIADPAVASFNQTEGDIATFMRQPWVMTGSDASTGHPRVYGTFARKYAKYVVADHVLTLRQFIERSSALTADTFKLAGRGHLKAGAFADVVVFDPKTYAARATYEQPTLTAVGVQTVVVNGRLAVNGGKMTGIAAGRALPHTPTPGTCR